MAWNPPSTGEIVAMALSPGTSPAEARIYATVKDGSARLRHPILTPADLGWVAQQGWADALAALERRRVELEASGELNRRRSNLLNVRADLLREATAERLAMVQAYENDVFEGTAVIASKLGDFVEGVGEVVAAVPKAAGNVANAAGYVVAAAGTTWLLSKLFGGRKR